MARQAERDTGALFTDTHTDKIDISLLKLTDINI